MPFVTRGQFDLEYLPKVLVGQYPIENVRIAQNSGRVQGILGNDSTLPLVFGFQRCDRVTHLNNKI